MQNCSLGLRGRLVLILLIAFVGLSSLIVWRSLDQHADYLKASGESLLGSARLLAARQQTVVARGDALLNSAMLIPALRGTASDRQCAALLERLAREAPFSRAGKLAPNGDELCTTPAGPTGRNLADRPWFRQAVDSRDMAISDIITGPEHPQIVLAKAMRGETGEVLAVYYLSLDLDRLLEELGRSDLPAGTALTVVDPHGTVLVTPPDPEGLSGRAFGDHALIRRLVRQHSEDVTTVRGPDIAPALVAFTPMLKPAAGDPHHLVLSLPTARIDADARRQLATSMAIALLLLAGVLALVYLGGHYYLVQPIKALSRTARRFGTGDLDIGGGLPRPGGEFQELWQSLEEMANALQAGTVSRARLQAEMDNLKLAESHLQTSRMTLSQATHIAELGVWSVDLADLDDFGHNPVNWSAKMYELLDYRPEDLPHPTAGHFFARVHPDDRHLVTDASFAALAEKQPWQIEYRLLRADGSERVVTEVGEFSFNQAGQPSLMLGAVMDITRRRKAENALRDNATRLRLALEGAGAGNYEWNVDSGTTSWSDELHTLLALGPDVDMASFATLRQVVHPFDQARVEAIIDDAVGNQAGFEVEWRIALPADPDVRWVLERASPVRDPGGRGLRYLGIIIDISKQKQNELALKRYREHLEEMVSERTARLSAADAEQRRLNRALRLLSDCNIALARATSEQQLLDDVCSLIVKSGGYLMAKFGIAERDAGKSVRLIAKSGYGDDTSHVQPSWNEDEAVKLSYQSSVALPIRGEGDLHGALTLYAGEAEAFGPEELVLLDELAANLTFGLQTLRARSELERYRLNLEQLVAERTREIGELNVELAARAEEAESANRTKSDFLATMSHEIRTPLNAVIGLNRLLADSLKDRRQLNYAEKIQNAAQVLYTLIDDILDFSKIEAGSLQLEQAPFSLDTILQAAAAVISGGIRGKNIEAFFDIAPNIPELMIGDALRLQQILLNLCSNAVKFTETGVIVVTIRRLVGPEGTATLQFAVRDTGIGIPPEQLDRIFEVFTQADSSTSRKYGGSGLGLAISARLVDAMGGRITVDSAERWGSEFCFTLTLDLPDQPPAPPSTGLPDLRILIVDDHPLSRDVLKRTCEGFGWQVTVLSSGSDCLEMLQSAPADGETHDLLLLDWHMPDMDGLETLKQAKTRSGVRLPLVVLMVPAFELAQAVAASDELYLDGIVTKPLTPASLFEAVHRAYTGEPLECPPLVDRNDQRLAGLRLLVAEDNDLNQEMVEQILSRAGAEVVIAGNGRIAVEMLRAPGADFDAVLMDVQMPVMDGYTATQVIRNELGRTDLPIVAVTAHARPEDREKSLAAGMAGHIVKPVDVDDLLGLLSTTRRNPRPAPAARPSGNTTTVLLPGLDVAAALAAFGGDAGAYAGLLRQFVERHAGDVDKARRCLQSGDPLAAAKWVHDLRGMAGYLKATEIARLSALAENALRGEAPDSASPLFEELALAITALVASIDRLEACVPAA